MLSVHEFFNLNNNTFSKFSTIDNIYRSNDFIQSYSRMAYSVENEGICLISGEAGSGKSTSIRKFINDLSKTSNKIIFIQGAEYTLFDFFEFLGEELEVKTANCHKTQIIKGIKKQVSILKDKNIKTTLIIDDIDLITASVLNELKLLYDYGVNESEAISLILISSSGFRNLLKHDKYKNIKENIVVNYDFKGFSLSDTKNYINQKINGSKIIPLEDKVTALIHEKTQGIPRKINILMSNLLMIGLNNESYSFTINDVLQAEKEVAL